MTHCLVNHHISGYLVFVLVSTECVMMCPAVDNSARCDIRAVIRFSHTKNMSGTEIHRDLMRRLRPICNDRSSCKIVV
jgi:hypothetical protein